MDGTSSPTRCRGCCCRRARRLRRTFRGLILRARPVRHRSCRWRLAPSSRTSDDLAQNGWFVGFTPRRNPDIVVCVLFQGGEHGRLAARLATQVIKAYVDKQQRTPQKMVEKPKTDGNGGHRRPVERARCRRRQRQLARRDSSFSICRRSRCRWRLLRRECSSSELRESSERDVTDRRKPGEGLDGGGSDGCFGRLGDPVCGIDAGYFVRSLAPAAPPLRMTEFIAD